MDKILISVIVPVYNCETYLEDSIESLINQTIFDKIEFIFVDDGSIDNSYKILKKYDILYENFVIYHQNNKGVSAARNYGIKKANGEYISFFDSDDIAQPELYEKLYNLILENKADISIIDYSMVFDDGVRKKRRPNLKKEWLDSKTAILDFFSTNLICTNPWDKMFKANIAKDILFPEGYAVGEDMFYVYNALKKSNNVVLDSNDSLYDYVLHSTSVMKQKFSEKHIDAVKLAKIIVDDCKNKEQIYAYAYANYIHEICKMLELMYRSNSEKEYLKIRKIYMKELYSYKISDALFFMSKKQFVGFLLMRLSPSLYTMLYRLLKIG